METLFLILCLLGIGAAVLLWWLGLKKTKRILLLQEEKQLAEQERELVMNFMHHMVEAIGGGADREELWQRIVHAAMQSSGAMSAAVFELQEGDQLRGVAVEGLFPPHRPLSESSRMKLTTRAKYLESVLKSETFSIGEGIVGTVARARKGELIEDATRDPRINQHDDPVLLVRSIIACPILFQNELLGVLAVVNPSDGLPFNRTDFSLVENLAEQAGLAIHNADSLNLQLEKKRIDMELELASNIQSMLLPQAFPEHPEVDISATYIPAQKVGGDLYDIFELPENRIGVAIADVSGKGAPGSLLMAICQTNLRHFARHNDSPAAVLQAINGEMMSVGMRRDKFVTMIYAILDVKENTMVLARAGHEKPILLHQDPQTGDSGTVEQINSPGMALGMVPPAIFNQTIADCSARFGPGDALVLYTDGVTEATNEDEREFSYARLADSVRKLRWRSPGDINVGILEIVDRFSGQDRYDDDLTLITAKRKVRVASETAVDG